MKPVPQPAKAILVMQRRTAKSVADHIGYSDHYVRQVLNGWQAPSPRLRAQMSELLGLPESALFREEWFEVAAAR